MDTQDLVGFLASFQAVLRKKPSAMGSRYNNTTMYAGLQAQMQTRRLALSACAIAYVTPPFMRKAAPPDFCFRRPWQEPLVGEETGRA